MVSSQRAFERLRQCEGFGRSSRVRDGDRTVQADERRRIHLFQHPVDVGDAGVVDLGPRGGADVFGRDGGADEVSSAVDARPCRLLYGVVEKP